MNLHKVLCFFNIHPEIKVPVKFYDKSNTFGVVEIRCKHCQKLLGEYFFPNKRDEALARQTDY